MLNVSLTLTQNTIDLIQNITPLGPSWPLDKIFKVGCRQKYSEKDLLIQSRWLNTYCVKEAKCSEVQKFVIGKKRYIGKKYKILQKTPSPEVGDSNPAVLVDNTKYRWVRPAGRA